MKKRFFSILLCFCMVLGLLPATALATDYPDGWPSDPSSLVADTDTVAIDGITYTYKGEADTSGIQLYNGDGMSYDALTEAYCWKAGSGYVLYNPTVESGKTTSAKVTLHNATISTESATALDLPISGNMDDGPFPVPVTVYVEDENSLATSDAAKCALDNDGGSDTLITGGGTLSLTNSASSGLYSSIGGTVVTIDSGTQVTVSGGSENTIQKLAVTGSDSKLTIVSGTQLNIINICTVDEGAVLENNGTLKMMYGTKDDPGITGEISGSGGIVFSSESETVYCLVDGEFTPYGGDISTSGLNLSGKNADGSDNSAYNAPTEVTRYKAGSGYAVFTPADGSAQAKLTLHGAQINTTNATAISLPSDAPVNIVVASDSTLTAGGSGNVIANNGQELSILGTGNLTLTGLYYGISVNSANKVNVNIDIDGDLTFDVGSQPIYTSGNITVSAKSITSKTGYYFNGNIISLTAKHGDISLTTKDSLIGAVNGTSVVSLLASEGAVTINHADNAQGGYVLNGSQVTVSADKDVTITTSRGGILASSGVSVSSTTGSITMDCATDECVNAGDIVTLNAAKDVTLNNSSDASTAVQTSGKDVYVTAGGTLTSSSAYGFQTGALTIKANEVSIAGTKQDGIQATSVSITNTDGTSNCKSVSVTATSSSDSWAAINSSNVTIKADDVLICGNSSAKAINAANINGTVTIDDAGMIIGAVSISGTNAINANILHIESTGADASARLDLSTPPDVITYYKAGNGYALFTPATTTPAAPATLTLHNASIDATTTPLQLGAETVIKLEGENSLTNSNTTSGVGIRAISSTTGEYQPVTIQGGSDDSLTVSAFQCTSMGALTIDGGSVTMDGMVYGILAEGNVVLKNGARVSASGGEFGAAVQLEDPSETEQYSLTVSDGSTLTVNESYADISGDLTVSGSGSKVTVNSGATAMVLGTVKVENSGVLENNGIWQMELGTTVNEIKALKLTGSGLVRARTNEDGPPIWDTYTNDGVKLNVIGDGTTGLDLATGSHTGATVETDGYSWDGSTLTLGNHAYVDGGLTLPCDTAVTINTAASSSISGGITAATDAGGYHHPLQLTFTGSAPLTISGGINSGVDGDTVTAQGGAQVTLNGSISIGASGTDGTLTVSGTGTALNITSDSAYGAICDTIRVQNGASLTAHSQGSFGLEALAGGVHVTGGSTLTVGCDYGVYITNGIFEVDDSSTFTANATIAAVCVVDTDKAMTQDQALAVSSSLLSSGVLKDSAIGDTIGRKYWSFRSSVSTLSATDENSSPATLAGALGALTLKKASSNNNNNCGSSGGSGGGSASGTNYTLTFETNGGAAISSVSKTSGTAVDLSGYKPTRDGYTFAGWYSDAALTTKVTSVTLTKSTTVYAKWTEKTAQSANPFADVADSAYYHDAVLWAVEKGITSGTTGTTFSPGMICTRAQAVTFLWKAMGAPEPTSANCPFTDVSADDYYYKAVLWAIEKGIVKGTSPTTFSPNDTVTRSQSMTFLWRAAGETTSISANPFADVSKDAYYYNAVLWAVEKDITKGTSDTAFSPDGGCTRAQIVTFLYRYMGK